MSTTKITDLTAYTDPINTDVLPIVDVTSDVTKKVSIANVMKNASLGSAAAPGIAFDGDPNTGIYSPGANQVAISTDGTARLTASTTAITAAIPVDVLLGSASTPSYTFTGDPNTGIYSPGADQLALSTNGTGRLFVDASGNVGVGAEAAKKFQIARGDGDATVSFGVGSEASSGDTARNFVITKDAAGTDYAANVYFSNHATTNAGYLAIHSSQTNELLRITSAGLVGIGTSAPADMLHISGTVPDIRFTDTTGDEYKIGNNNGVFRVYNQTDANTPFAITGTGNVGVGTTSPSEALTVQGNASFTVSGTERFSIKSSGSPLIEYKVATNNYFLTLESVGTSQGAILFNTGTTAASERARIDSSGRLLVGTSSTVVSSTVVLQGRSGVPTGEAILRLCRGQDTPADAAALGEVSFGDSNNGDAARIVAQRDGGTWTSASSRPSRLVFFTAADGAASPTEALRITNDRYVRLASGTGGIQFNGDTAAANALDDYEEGTFTPTIVGTTTAGTATYTSQVGRYTKIGNRVYVQVSLIWTAHTGTGDMRIAGLPFTSANASNPLALFVSNLALSASNYAQGYVLNNLTQVTIQQVPVGGGAAAFVPIDAAATIVAGGHYETA